MTVVCALEQKSVPVVGVFCSADDKILPEFKKAAFELGKRLALKKYGLVTGGSKTGLMKEVVDGYVSNENSGEVYGVMPNAFKNYDAHHPAIASENLTWTETVHNRLAIFHEKCTTIIILPGGFGTLHELMDFLVHNQFAGLKTKMILLNVEGFWNALMEQFKHMVATNALNEKHFQMIQVCDSLDDCLTCIDANPTDRHKGLEDRYWEAKADHQSV